MHKTCAAAEMGRDAFCLVTVVLHTEDAARYSGPVRFWNSQLMETLGFTKWDQFAKARNKAIEAGWLAYENEGNRSAGRYHVTIPDGIEDVSDDPIEDPLSPDLGYKLGYKDGYKQGVIEGIKRGQSGVQTGDNVGELYNPNPNPNPNPKEYAHSDESAQDSHCGDTGPKDDKSIVQPVSGVPGARERPSRENLNEQAERIYNAYPRKIGKANAIKRIKQAIVGALVTADELFEAVSAYATATSQWAESDRQFIPHPATWVYQQRWNDDRAEWQAKSRGSPRDNSVAAKEARNRQAREIAGAKLYERIQQANAANNQVHEAGKNGVAGLLGES